MNAAGERRCRAPAPIGARLAEFANQMSHRPSVVAEEPETWPRLSIITPSFNQGRFLERTILSVLNQDYPNLEYLVIDGGSTDESVDVIRKYAHRITYWVSERDNGQSDAVNKGFRKATGDIIGWQNSDDVYLPGSFRRAVTTLLSRAPVDIVFSDRLDVDTDDRVIGESRFTDFSLTSYWYEGMSLSNQSTFFRRRVLESAGLLDPSLDVAMDYEFFLRVALRRARFHYVRDYWGAIRRHEASKQNTLWADKMKRECEIIDRRYGRKTALNTPLRLYAMLRRLLLYIVQGDGDYAIRRLVRRARRHLALPVDP